MKKWLVVAGFIGAFAVGSMTSGLISPNASSDSGEDDTTVNAESENGMMEMSDSNAMDMMGDSNGMDMMGNMSEMMDTMSIMNDLMTELSSEAAQTLDMTTDELQSEIKSGKSLATIAEEQGIKGDKLTKELEKVIQEDIKQYKKEENGITDQQEMMLLSMSENIGMMLNVDGMFACNAFGE